MKARLLPHHLHSISLLFPSEWAQELDDTKTTGVIFYRTRVDNNFYYEEKHPPTFETTINEVLSPLHLLCSNFLNHVQILKRQWHKWML